MKQSLCCRVPEAQACAYQLLPSHQAELGAHPDALSSPAVEARSWEQMGSSCCHYASLPACLDFITAKSERANFSGAGFGAQNEGLSAWEGSQILRHPPGQELLDAVWTRRDKHWKLNKMSKDLLASVKQIPLSTLKHLSSYPWLWMCSILHCCLVTKWMALFHRWIVWSESICPVSLTWRGKKKKPHKKQKQTWPGEALKVSLKIKNLIHHTN